MEAHAQAIDYAAITERQRQTWATGDFHEIARQTMAAAEALCQAVDPHANERVLDVACGSGNAALIAARRYCQVTGIDYVPALIERAQVRAGAEGLEVDFRVADAQQLPFGDASFDAILSVFGVMFAPRQDQAARELLRVCRPGGRIGLAVWMPAGMVAEFFGVMSRYIPPPPGLLPPMRWGTEAGLAELLGAEVTSRHGERRVLWQYFRSVAHAVDVFTTYFGPAARALQVLDAGKRQQLLEEITGAFTRYNRATDGTVVLESEYLQVVATRA